jgi:hypothetical protein
MKFSARSKMVPLREAELLTEKKILIDPEGL